tara:strand:- start:2846 stop:4153 length:1308 start_codon:yes stop_codon:yes gene_type:complete
MANTIRLKKRASGGASGAPSSLAPSEPAYSEVDNILYYGFGDAGGGAASSVIAIAGSGAYCTLSGNQTLSGNKTFTGTVDLSGATLSGNTTFSNNLTITGDLTVQGTTTTIDSTTIDVADKNITLGNVTTPTDTTADGGGISLKGATDKLFRWLSATDSWTASEHIDLASGKEFKIAGTSVLSGSTLGSGVTSSSLTSVGTIATGTWNGDTIGRAYGGTGLTAAPANGQLLIGNGTSYTLSTLTAGSNVTITEGSGTITIASSGGASVAAGDGIDVNGSTVSVDLKADGGLVIESTELAVDLGASSITGTLAVADGGTGSTSASDARTALGVAIGSDVQAYDADLGILSGMQTGGATALAALTSTEIAILDGATVTTSELNIIDGGTSATSTTLAAADRMVINDAGTMVQVALSDLVTFLEDGTASSFELDGGTF